MSGTRAELGPSSIVDLDVDAVAETILDRPTSVEALRGTSVLVTGAGGMLPSYVVLTLAALNDRADLGIRVTALVRNAERARRTLGDALLERPDVSLVEQDVSDPFDVDGPIDVIVHGASAARPSLHSVDPVGTIRANVVGTTNLLDFAVRRGASRFVLMSSAEVYGAQPPERRLIGEDDYGGFDILSPRSCYSEGKRAAESIGAAYHSQYGIHTTTARFGHVYGPGMALDDGRVQADFAASVIRGEDIRLNSDGSAVRTYTYVGDAVTGMFTAMLEGQATAYNIADADGLVSIRELAEQFAAARPDRHLTVTFAGSAEGRAYNPAARSGLDSSRLLALGWRPRVDLPSGIDRLLRHHEEVLART